MSDLVGKSEDRISCDAAQIMEWTSGFLEVAKSWSKH